MEMIFPAIKEILIFFCYYLAYRVLFNAKFRKNPLWLTSGAIASCAVSMLLSYLLQTIIPIEELVFFAVIIPTLILIADENKLRVFAYSPIIWSALSSCFAFFSYVFSYFSKDDYYSFLHSYFCDYFCCGITLIMLMVCLLLSRNKEKNMIKLNIIEYFLMLICGICFFAVSGIIQSFSTGRALNNGGLMKFTAISCDFLSLVLYFLIIWQIVLKRNVTEYKDREKRYSYYLEKQEEKIREITESDKQVRKFRHDMRAHITALEAAVNTGDIESLKEYIERMREEENNYIISSFTGIASIDAVISEAKSRAEQKQIRFCWSRSTGLNAGETEIYDLCVVSSNLLNNAIEAAEMTEEGRDRYIEIGISNVGEKIIFSVVNSCMYNVRTDAIERTTKHDMKNHGFGIENIKETAEKYGGDVSFEAEEGVFKATVIL